MNFITGFEQLSQRVFPQGAGFVAALVAALGLEAAFTILVTTLVVVRLMFVRRRHINLMGGYVSVSTYQDTTRLTAPQGHRKLVCST